VTNIRVPYHHDEPLADDSLVLPGESVTVEPELPDGTIWERLASLAGAVADVVAQDARAGAVPSVVSGDCLVALGTIAGLQRAGVDPGVVWFDAHGDVHTLETTTSGYLGGLALRLALGAHPELLAEPLGLRPVPVDRVVLVDARDLDPAERAYLASGGPDVCAVNDLDAAALPGGPFVLHVDVDVIDAAELPGLRFPAPGGPSTDDVLRAVRKVLATGRVAALDIAAPWHAAPDGQAAEIRTVLLKALLAS
jgi:arginase